MSHFDLLRSKALENYGVVTSSIAADLGLRTNEVVRFCQDGRIIRVGYGTYLLADYTPTRLTRFAQAVAIVGEGSYICGRSALVLCDLLPYEPGCICVATAQRVRKTLPKWISLKKASATDICIEFGCIPSQSPASALESCRAELTSEQVDGVTSACKRNDILCDVQRSAVLAILGIPTHEVE